MSAPRETGSGLPWLDYQVARAASARPTGVPLTADNVADAVECRAANGDTWRYRGGAVWECGASIVDMMTLVFFAERWGTVVTKWREP